MLYRLSMLFPKFLKLKMFQVSGFLKFSNIYIYIMIYLGDRSKVYRWNSFIHNLIILYILSTPGIFTVPYYIKSSVKHSTVALCQSSKMLWSSSCKWPEVTCEDGSLLSQPRKPYKIKQVKRFKSPCTL